MQSPTTFSAASRIARHLRAMSGNGRRVAPPPIGGAREAAQLKSLMEHLRTSFAALQASRRDAESTWFEHGTLLTELNGFCLQMAQALEAYETARRVELLQAMEGLATGVH